MRTPQPGRVSDMETTNPSKGSESGLPLGDWMCGTVTELDLRERGGVIRDATPHSCRHWWAQHATRCANGDVYTVDNPIPVWLWKRGVKV